MRVSTLLEYESDDYIQKAKRIIGSSLNPIDTSNPQDMETIFANVVSLLRETRKQEPHPDEIMGWMKELGDVKTPSALRYLMSNPTKWGHVNLPLDVKDAILKATQYFLPKQTPTGLRNKINNALNLSSESDVTQVFRQLFPEDTETYNTRDLRGGVGVENYHWHLSEFQRNQPDNLMQHARYHIPEPWEVDGYEVGPVIFNVYDFQHQSDFCYDMNVSCTEQGKITLFLNSTFRNSKAMRDHVFFSSDAFFSCLYRFYSAPPGFFNNQDINMGSWRLAANRADYVTKAQILDMISKYAPPAQILGKGIINESFIQAFNVLKVTLGAKTEFVINPGTKEHALFLKTELGKSLQHFLDDYNEGSQATIGTFKITKAVIKNINLKTGKVVPFNAKNAQPSVAVFIESDVAGRSQPQIHPTCTYVRRSGKTVCKTCHLASVSNAEIGVTMDSATKWECDDCIAGKQIKYTPEILEFLSRIAPPKKKSAKESVDLDSPPPPPPEEEEEEEQIKYVTCKKCKKKKLARQVQAGGVCVGCL